MKMKKLKLLAALAPLIAGLAVTAAPAADELDHECTSWMVFSDLTKNNTNLLHKNRDAAKYRDIVVIRNQPGSTRRWIGLGNVGNICMGMNSSGLAAVMNSGELCIGYSKDMKKKSTPQNLRYILETCDTAAQAAAAIKKQIEIGDYSHPGKRGSIFFFTDTKEGYICEMTAKYCSVQRYDNSYAFRANIWHNPGMAQLSRSLQKSFLDSCGRETVVMDSLNTALDKNGVLTLQDMRDLARRNTHPKDSELKRSVCSKYTNSASTQVVHKEFPETLSTVWALIGHPRHTIYVPIPVCVEKLHPAMLSKEWSAAAWKRFDKLGADAEIPAEWTALEQQSIAEYEKAVKEAETLLRNGKKAEAVKLLNTTAAGIWAKAYDLCIRPQAGK